MAVTQATTLADFTSGIGTAGAVFQVDNANNRIGIGTTNPQSLLDVDGHADIAGIATVITLHTTSGSYSAGIDTKTDAAIIIKEEGAIYTEDGTQYLRTLIEKKSDKINIGQHNTTLIDSIELKPGNNGQVKLHHGGNSDNVKFQTTGIGISVSNGAASTATIAAPANLVIDPAVVGDNTGLVRIKGDLFVDGTTTQINSTTLEISDFIVGIASTATTDLLTDGAGIKIGPDNTFLYEHNGGTNASLKSSENLNVATGKVYQIGETERLSADTLSVGTGATVHSPSSDTLTLGTNDEERLRITSDGKVGINETSPNGSLHIGNLPTGSGNVNVVTLDRDDGTLIYGIDYNGSSNLVSFTGNNKQFAFANKSGAAEAVRILASGNVGIGLTNPTEKLHLIGQVGGSNPSAGSKWDIARFVSHNYVPANSGGLTIGAYWDNSDVNGRRAYIQSSQNLNSGSSARDLLLNPDGGDVGIGTNIPSNLLHVNGQSRFEDYLRGHSTNNKLYIADDVAISATKKLYFDGGSNTYIDEVSADTLRFSTSGSERLSINSDGELVSTNGTLRRNVSDSSFTVSGDSASNTGANINLYGASHSSLANIFRVRTGSSERLRVSASGNLEIGTVVDAGNGLRNVDIQNINTGNSAGAIMRLITSQSDDSGTTSVDIVKYKTGGLFITNNENNGTTGFIAFNTAESGGSATERLRITSAGLVGIGTNNPATNLDVNGSLQLRAAGNYTTYATRIYSRLDSTHCSVIESYLNNSSAFEMMGTYADSGGANPRIVLGAGGQEVGINTTNPQAQLHVRGTIYQTDIEYPTIRPTLDLNFAATKVLDDRITFTRDSIGTYYGDDGLLKYASSNTPRFDHDPDTRESLGLLLEYSSTNLISGSGGYGSDIRGGTNLGNAPTTAVVDGITLPDGTVGQVRRLQIHSSGNSGMRWGSTGGGNINTAYSASVWARAVSGTANFSIDTNDQGNVSYNLTEEWVRMEVTGTTSEGAYQFMDLVGSANANGYFWGFQLENKPFVSSYIPVASNESSKTRAQDTAKITGSNFTDFYNQNESTLFVNYKLDKNNYLESPAGVDMVTFRTDGNSHGYDIRIVTDTSTPTLDAHGVHNSVAQYDLAGISLSSGFKDYFIAKAFKLNDVAVSFDGATPQTDTTAAVVERDTLYIGYVPRRAHYKSIKYFNKRLPNAQLQGLTQQ